MLNTVLSGKKTHLLSQQNAGLLVRVLAHQSHVCGET